MKTDNNKTDIDWNLTTWEGSRRESLRRWASLPLEQVILALEEMQELNSMFEQTDPVLKPGEKTVEFVSKIKKPIL